MDDTGAPRGDRHRGWTQRLRPHPHDREILRLAIPALGALLAEPLYILADTAVVGHLGTDQLAGLAVASSALLLGYAVFIFLAYGTTAAVARLFGAGREEEAAHQAVQSLWLALLIGLVLLAVGMAIAPWILRALGADGAVLDNALVYLRVSLLGAPAMLLVLSGTGYLRGLQDTRTPLVVAVVSAAGNLLLEIALIYGLGLGIGASAAATVVAQWGAAAVYVLWVGRAVRDHAVALRPHWATIGDLARVGRDLFIRTAALRGSLTLSVAVAARIGTADLAAYQVAFEIWSFLALGLDAVAIAGQSIMGRRLGASDGIGARAAGRRITEWGLGTGLVVGVAVAVLAPWLPRIFTSDPTVIALATYSLWWVAATQPVNGVVFALDGVLIGAGDMRFLAVAMVVALAVFAPAALAVAWLGLGLGWLWAALLLLMVARLALLGVRFAGRGWMVLGAPSRA